MILMEFILELYVSGTTLRDLLTVYPQLMAKGAQEALRHAARFLKNEVVLTAEVAV